MDTAPALVVHTPLRLRCAQLRTYTHARTNYIASLMSDVMSGLLGNVWALARVYGGVSDQTALVFIAVVAAVVLLVGCFGSIFLYLLCKQCHFSRRAKLMATERLARVSGRGCGHDHGDSASGGGVDRDSDGSESDTTPRSDAKAAAAVAAVAPTKPAPDALAADHGAGTGASPRTPPPAQRRLCVVCVKALLLLATATLVAAVLFAPATEPSWATGALSAAWARTMAAMGAGSDDSTAAHAHIHAHSHDGTARSLQQEWVQQTDDIAFFSCLRQSFDVGPAWVAMDTPELEVFVSTGGAEDQYNLAAIANSRPSQPPLEKLVTPWATLHAHMTIIYWNPIQHRSATTTAFTTYLFEAQEHTRAHNDRMDIVLHTPVVKVWKLAEVLHSILHHLPGTTVSALKHVSLWLSPAMRNTMRVYNYKCVDAVVAYPRTDAIMRATPTGRPAADTIPAPGTVHVHADGATTDESTAGPEPELELDASVLLPIESCADRCAREGLVWELGAFVEAEYAYACACSAIKCVADNLNHHTEMVCTAQDVVPPAVWHAMLEAQ